MGSSKYEIGRSKFRGLWSGSEPNITEIDMEALNEKKVNHRHAVQQ